MTVTVIAVCTSELLLLAFCKIVFSPDRSERDRHRDSDRDRGTYEDLTHTSNDVILGTERDRSDRDRSDRDRGGVFSCFSERGYKMIIALFLQIANARSVTVVRCRHHHQG